MKLIFTIILFTVFCLRLVAQQPGTLDKSFGEEGKVVSNTYEGRNYASLQQSDGKILVAGAGGYYDNQNILIAGFRICRYTSNGTLDEHFGNKGRSVNDLGEKGLTKNIYAMALQTDGKIVAAGQYAASGEDSRIAVMRFNEDGTVDDDFGSKGLTVTSISQYYDIAHDMALLPDGRIIVTGDVSSGVNDNKRSFIACYTPNGVLDKSFGKDGIVIVELNTAMDIHAVVVTDDSKIIIGGNYSIYSSNILLRYHSDGTTDKSFGVGGLAELRFAKNISDCSVKDIALTADNKIVTAGYAGFNSGITAITVSQFTQNGTPDSSFGTNAYTTTKYEGGEAYANSVAIQQNGKIILGGYFVKGDAGMLTTARYDRTGLLDSSFGVNGISNATITGDDITTSVLVQHDDKIVVSGYSFDLDAYKWRTILVRYNSEDNHQQPLIVRIKKWLQHRGITWQYNSNVRYYIVQRSLDGGITYIDIAKVYAANNRQLYNYEDASSAATNSNNVSFRLGVVARNGTRIYSNTVLIDKTEQARIFPNPVRNNLQLQGLPSKGKTWVSIVDWNGNLRSTITTIGSNYSVSTASLRSGYYLLKIQNNGTITTQPFVKQ